MERLRRIVNRLLFPGAAVVILSIPVAAVLLVYIFVFGHQEGRSLIWRTLCRRMR